MDVLDWIKQRELWREDIQVTQNFINLFEKIFYMKIFSLVLDWQNIFPLENRSQHLFRGPA